MSTERFGARLVSRASMFLLVTAVLVLAFPLAGIATGRWRLLPILSGSMAPRLPTGALALAMPASHGSVSAGDVVVFNIPIGDHHLTAHRVVRVLSAGRNPVVETKGDANSTPDPWRLRLNGGEVWTVRAHIPLAGYAVVFARRSRPLLVLGVGVLALLAIALRLVWRQPAKGADAKPVAHVGSPT